ncbi:MAG: hypothetical protein J0L92_35000 [Deltaproteobacteria bacterium]|nr:hypothetical protein [Deltaproteobacteria bacterium]
MRGDRCTRFALVCALAGCAPAPGEGEPCLRESTGDYGGTAYVRCADGLECDRTLCLRPDGPEAPRRFGDFEALYDPRREASSPGRLFEESGNGLPFLALDRDRLIVGADFLHVLDHGGASARTVGVRFMENATDSIALTEHELWALGELGSRQGFDRSTLTPLRTGFFPADGEDARGLVGNEAGELAWIEPGAIAVLRSRDSMPERTPTTGTLQRIVVEPGGAVLALSDGQLVAFDGRSIGAHEPLAGLHRPLGGPILGWIDVDDATSPTRVVIVSPDGTLAPLVTLPAELEAVTVIDAHEGRLYVASEWGLFRSLEPIQGL